MKDDIRRTKQQVRNTKDEVSGVFFTLLAKACFGVVFVGGLLSSPAFANSPGDEVYQNQDLPARTFEESDWEKAKEGIDYSEDIQPKSEEEEQQPSTTPQDESTAQAFFKIVLLIGGVALLILLLYFVLTGGFTIKNTTPKRQKAFAKSLEEVEEDLENADPADLLQRAIEQGEYSLAVRLYYLSILRELSLQKIIRWKKDKTNQDYLREASSSAFFADFQHFTRLFEYIWYGEQRFSQTEFTQIQPQLEGFIQEIKGRRK